MKRKVTIKDVAKEAGVSATTVSYVLNQNEKQTISEETKERVYRAVEKLNYIPNYAARIMKNDESLCIGLVMNRSFKIGRFSTIVAGIMDELETMDYRVLLCAGMQREGQYSGYLEDYFRHHLDGLIYICNDNQGPSEEDRKVIANNQIPMVVFDSLEQDAPYETVDFDYYAGTVNVLNAMIRPEMERLVYIRPCNDTRQEQIRERAFRDTMQKFPHLEYDVIRETMEADASRRQEAREELSGLYASQFKAFLEQEVLDTFRKLSPSDGILASWGIWLPLIRDVMEEYHVEAKLGTLAQTQEAGWGRQEVVQGRYHNYRVGKTCAKILLNAIQDSQNGTSQIRHQVMDVEASRAGG